MTRGSASPGETHLRSAAATVPAVIFLVAIAAGCSLGPTPQAPDLEPVPATLPSTDELEALLAAQGSALSSFRGQARLRYKSPTESFRASQMILVRAPGSVRIDVMNPFGLTYSLATDGTRLSAFDYRDRVYYEGAASRRNVKRFAGVPLHPVTLSFLVRGLPPELDEAGPGHVTRSPEGVVWERRLADGGRSLLTLDHEHLQPTHLALLDSAILGTVEASFGGYRDIDGARVAHEVELLFADGARLELTYDKVWRDIAVGDGTFRIKVPPSAKVVDMDAGQ